MPNSHALRRVREQRGLDLGQVADFTAIAFDRLRAFEQGDRAPSRKQLDRLADAYGVPLYSLFSEAIPNLPALPIDFRKPEPSPAALSPRGFKTYLATEKVAHYTLQLIHELNFEPAKIKSDSDAKDKPEDRARKLRRVFDAWHEPRAKTFDFSGAKEQRFLGALRLFFEVQGGVLNVNDAPSDDYFGFYTHPDAGSPAIFVNRSISSKKAQLFTLAHEYYHWMIGAEGISNPFSSKNKIERACNKFAAEFIAPIHQFSRSIEGLSSSIRGNIFDLIDAASSQSLLSRHAAAIRLSEAGYISDSQYRTWRRVFVSKPKQEKEEEKEGLDASGPAQHAKRIGELGYLPIVLSKIAIDKQYIDQYDVQAGIGLALATQEKAYALAIKRFEAAQP